MYEPKPKKHYKLVIFLVALFLLLCGMLLFAIIYLQMTDRLSDILDIVREFLKTGGIFSILLVFWVLIIPLLLVVLLIVNKYRRKKYRHVRDAWKEALRIVAEREAAERAAKEALEKQLPPPRFSQLNEMDESRAPREKRQGERISSLQELCTKFRNFAAGRLGLFYSPTDIREFISSLAVSHIILLQGMSGTGKTSLAYAFGEFLGNPSVIIPVQPMWKERTDLLGYYNEFTKKFNETLLLEKMYEANKRKDIYIAVLDELNIARVEYYFAEFLSLLEIPDAESRYLDVVPDVWENDPQGLKHGRIKLPENMWFIGTANNDDSTFAISDKVYDRAMVLELDRKAEEFVLSEEEAAQKPVSFTAEEFGSLIEREQAWFEITTRNERRLRVLDEYLIDKFQITFGNRIMKQIRNYISVYVSCGGEEMDALDDILCKKVFRKFEALNAAYVRSEADALCSFMNGLFGEGRMARCLAYIHRIARNG